MGALRAWDNLWHTGAIVELGTRVEPHLFVVFGGTGDLMRRKLLPALARLNDLGFLGGDFKILGVSRRTMDDGAFREWARGALAEAGIPKNHPCGIRYSTLLLAPLLCV